jgi:hypothetical protein
VGAGTDEGRSSACTGLSFQRAGKTLRETAYEQHQRVGFAVLDRPRAALCTGENIRSRGQLQQKTLVKERPVKMRFVAADG